MNARHPKTCIRFAFAFCLGIGSGLHGGLQAQEPGPPSHLIKILEKETSQKKEENAFTQPVMVKVTVPPQIFTPPSAAFFPCPGISDPGKDTLEARKQAIERACMLRGLLSGANLRHVGDLFSVSRPGDKKSLNHFEEYYEVRSGYSDCPVPESTFHFTHLTNGECIAWIPAGIPQTDTTHYPVRSLTATLYLNEKMVFRPSMAFRVMYEAVRQGAGEYQITDGMEFTWYPNGKCLYFNPTDTLPAQNNPRQYYYMTPDNPADTETAGGIPVSEGLWPALMSCLLLQITELQSTEEAKFKSLSESFKHEYSNLQRTIRSANVSLNPGCISIGQQRMHCASKGEIKPQESKEP